MIKREDDYFQAHCLQFDLVTTADTLEETQEAIISLCIAHIQFTLDNDNIAYLFPPAPQEIWTEYYVLANDPGCQTAIKEIDVPQKEKKPALTIPAFIAQEILCNAYPFQRA